MKVLIGTKNPGKIEGAKLAIQNYFDDFEIIGVPVDSNVSDEPVNEETLQGAKNRVKNLEKYAKENNIDADMYFAIESGISNQLGSWGIVNIAVIKDKNGYESFGAGPVFPVPEKFVEPIIKDSLGTVMDELLQGNELSKGKGGISFLTHDVISRIDITKAAFVMALTQFVNDFWNDKKGE